jgi:hypothetical protein
LSKKQNKQNENNKVLMENGYKSVNYSVIDLDKYNESVNTNNSSSFSKIITNNIIHPSSQELNFTHIKNGKKPNLTNQNKIHDTKLTFSKIVTNQIIPNITTNMQDPSFIDHNLSARKNDLNEIELSSIDLNQTPISSIDGEIDNIPFSSDFTLNSTDSQSSSTCCSFLSESSLSSDLTTEKSSSSSTSTLNGDPWIRRSIYDKITNTNTNSKHLSSLSNVKSTDENEQKDQLAFNNNEQKVKFDPNLEYI